MTRMTITEVARRLGVSAGTVSRVVNDSPNSGISAQTRKRVLAECSRVGYKPNAMARALVTRENPGIGLLCNSLLDYNIMRAVQEGLKLATRLGRHVVISTDLDGTTWLDLLREGRVGWVITLARGIPGEVVRDQLDEDLLNRVIRIWEGPMKKPSASPFTVTWDSGVAGKMAVEHLAQLGHREIAVLAGPFEEPEDRFPRIASSYFRGRELGLTVRWITNSEEQGGMIPQSGQEMMRKVLEEFPKVTAVICRQDYHAVGVYRELHRRGLRILEDMAVMGHQNLQPGLHLEPGLTSVATPVVQAVEIALRFAIEGQKNFSERVYDLTSFCRLIPRASTVGKGIVEDE